MNELDKTSGQAVIVDAVVSNVRAWTFDHITPAHGRLMVDPDSDRVAVDYGHKIRIYSNRKLGQAPWPCLFADCQEIDC